MSFATIVKFTFVEPEPEPLKIFLLSSLENTCPLADGITSSAPRSPR